MTTTAIMKKYLTVQETADYLGLSKHTIYRMIKTQIIPYTTFGRVKRFDRERLDKWVSQRSVEGKV